jgi:hypothetical protein
MRFGKYRAKKHAKHAGDSSADKNVISAADSRSGVGTTREDRLRDTWKPEQQGKPVRL